MNRYAFFLVLSMLFVGSNVGIGKSIVVFVPVAILATLRFVIAIAVLWPLFSPVKMRKVKRGEWLNLFLQAFFGTFMFTLLMLNGVQRTSAVAAGVITSTIPAIVALFAWLILREKPNGRALVSIALAIAGVVTINLANGSAAGHGASSLTGNLLILGAVCCESIYVILSRRLTQTLAPIDICAYTHLFGLCLMLPLGATAGTAELGNRHAALRQQALDTLMKVLDDWFPHAADRASARFWVGRRPMTPDGPPLLGASGIDGLWLNVGHGSTGWAMSMGSGKVVADLVTGREPEIDLSGLTLARYG